MTAIPVAALSRLNQHARASYGARHAIYAYKTLAAIALDRPARPTRTAAQNRRDKAQREASALLQQIWKPTRA